MTDNEIIKALECCLAKENCEEVSCEICPYDRIYSCKESMFQNALGLIKRKDAEIEQWKEEANKYQNNWCEAVNDIQRAESEAKK